MGKTAKDTPTSNKKPSVEPGSSSMQLSKGLAETSWRVALPFLVFSLGGIWLDGRYETEPIFTIIGLILALVGVTLIVYRFVNENFPDTFGKGDKK